MAAAEQGGHMRSAGAISRRTLLAGGSAAALAAFRPGLNISARAQASSGKLYLLGTQGGPNFSLTRGETASALQIGERMYMVDCGYGAIGGMKRAGLSLAALDAIFLTHLHDDHTSDLLPILTHLATQGRARDFTVYGPPGTYGLVAAIKAALNANAVIRDADEKRPAGFLDFIKAGEAAEGHPVMTEGQVRVSCAENSHYPQEIEGLATQKSFAYRFDWGRSVVFSGDTTYSEKLVELARGADIFVCEVLEPVAMRKAFDTMVAGGAFKGAEEGVWQHMIDTHSSPEQVGRMASQAKVRRLVLNHLAPGSLLELPDSTFIDAVGKAYDGPVIVGKDGMAVEI